MATTLESIASTSVKIFDTEQPEFLLIQPSARHEEKNDGLAREAELIRQGTSHGFALATFDTKAWAQALMPWHDDAVSKDEEVGLHAHDTLCFVLHELLPWLKQRYGNLP
jgi:hypothetical protein